MDKPKTSTEKVTQSVVDVISFTIAEAESWPLPPFQRALTINKKVMELGQKIADDGGVLPGTLTFAMWNGKQHLLDGQHRREGFFISLLPRGYADTRTLFFSGPTALADMADEYVKLNSRLVAFRPDDMLRAMEASSPALQALRKACPFVGYDMIRRSEKAPILSVSTTLRSWAASAPARPANSPGSVVALAGAFTIEESELLAQFLTMAMEAWGRDPEYQRLWGR